MGTVRLLPQQRVADIFRDSREITAAISCNRRGKREECSVA